MDTIDFILKGGRVIDPVKNLNGPMDARQDGKIAAIGESVGDAKQTINVAGRIVIPGMIDTHARFSAIAALSARRDLFACSRHYPGDRCAPAA